MQTKHKSLVFVVYMSQIQCGEDEMESMLQASRRNNRTADITGLLIRDRRNFLQILEGPATAVGLAMLRIAGDPRHAHMALLASQQVEMRLFSNWSMGMAEFTDKRSTIARKMEPIARLSPRDRADQLRRFALSFHSPI